MERVVVGMSGGIDSFVTAMLLREQGYEVVGVTLQLWEKNDLTQVRDLCDKINIPLFLKEGRSLFRHTVVEPFVESYLRGLTPSPCCMCNRLVKWKLLQEVADEYGAKYIATGHYVRIACLAGKYYIRKGIDPQKDQSYFLWGVSQEILKRALTPLGDYTKAQVKEWAGKNGYVQLADKPESMGVCFLQKKDYRAFVQQNTTAVCLPGKIVGPTGKVLGEHAGLLNYTIGQKRGIPSEDGEIFYVREIDTENNVILVAPRAALFTGSILVERVQVVSKEDLWASDVEIKIRGLGLNPRGYVRIEELDECRLRVYFPEPAWAVAPGQPVAFYRGDILLGGGIAGKD